MARKKIIPVDFVSVDKNTEAVGFVQPGVIVRKKGKGATQDSFDFLPCAKLDVTLCDGKPDNVVIVQR